MIKRVLVNTDFFLMLAEGGDLQQRAADACKACQPSQLVVPRLALIQALDVVAKGGYSDVTARNMVEFVEHVVRRRSNAGLIKNLDYSLVETDDSLFRSAFGEYKRNTSRKWPLTRHLLVALAKRERARQVLSALSWFAEAGIEPLIQLPKPQPVSQGQPVDEQTAGPTASGQPESDADAAVDAQRSLPLPKPAG